METFWKGPAKGDLGCAGGLERKRGNDDDGDGDGDDGDDIRQGRGGHRQRGW